MWQGIIIQDININSIFILHIIIIITNHISFIKRDVSLQTLTSVEQKNSVPDPDPGGDSDPDPDPDGGGVPAPDPPPWFEATHEQAGPLAPPPDPDPDPEPDPVGGGFGGFGVTDGAAWK